MPLRALLQGTTQLVSSLLLNNPRFRTGKLVGTLSHVRAAELLAPGVMLGTSAVLGVLAVLALLLRARRERARLPEALRRMEQLSGALGDGVLVFDGSGRIVRVNDAAVQLLGTDRLLGMDVAALGPDVAAVARGLARGPASAFVAIETGETLVRAHASLARVSSTPALDMILLRAEELTSRPPALPQPRQAPPRGGSAEARAAVQAAAAALREPLSRAGRAASLLRLVGPPLPARAAAALATVESALDDADRRASLLSAAGEGGRGRALDVAALVTDLVGAFAPPPGVRVRTRLKPAIALGDDRPLRAALREILRAVAEGGGDVEVEVSSGAAGPSVAIVGRAVPEGAAALARALVAPHGGRVEEHDAPGRGHVVEVALVPADALAFA